MPKSTSITIVTLLLVSCTVTSILNATEVTKLTPKNWDDFVPAGKEVDAIYGDYAIRNDVLTAIIAQPKQSLGSLVLRAVQHPAYPLPAAMVTRSKLETE